MEKLMKSKYDLGFSSCVCTVVGFLLRENWVSGKQKLCYLCDFSTDLKHFQN